ncbi:MAG: SPOR domain-containing protein [Pseudomonas sp.]|uniref:SPOR domain-containing protein n=1 Tax=Pseudomonas abieticivorans TaxID=2931382 RepID=UPI0020BE30C0|nr:SPOR domain-containing protein [Pseudomonas sp. PIA16]MDE1166268.1 SPOR domain-containing protein [Pseudomonas sp.]
MRRLTMVVAVLALAGCGSAVESAAKVVLQQLDNPKTARFANVRTTQKGDICGQVRTKDAAGKYTAYQNYAAIKTADGFTAILDKDGNNPDVRAVCGEGQEITQAVDDTDQTSATGWEVQIVDGANMGALSDMTTRLIEHGFASNVATRDGVQQVYLGPFDTREAAEQKRSELLASEGIKSVVVKHKVQ